MGQPQQTEQSNILNQNIYITQKNKSSMLTLLACLRKRIYVAQVLTKHTSRLGLNGLNKMLAAPNGKRWKFMENFRCKHFFGRITELEQLESRIDHALQTLYTFADSLEENDRLITFPRTKINENLMILFSITSFTFNLYRSRLILLYIRREIDLSDTKSIFCSHERSSTFKVRPARLNKVLPIISFPGVAFT